MKSSQKLVNIREYSLLRAEHTKQITIETSDLQDEYNSLAKYFILSLSVKFENSSSKLILSARFVSD